MELIREIGCLDYIFCPVGGGGLISGTAIATKGLCPNSKIIAIEPKKADDAYRSFKDKKLNRFFLLFSINEFNTHMINNNLIVLYSE